MLVLRNDCSICDDLRQQLELAQKAELAASAIVDYFEQFGHPSGLQASIDLLQINRLMLSLVQTRLEYHLASNHREASRTPSSRQSSSVRGTAREADQQLND